MPNTVKTNRHVHQPALPDPAKGEVVRPMDPNKAEIVALAVVGSLCVSFLGWFAWATHKDELRREEESKRRMAEMARKREEREAWFEEQRKSGRVVIETLDGGYMAIPNEAYMKAEFRKKAL